MGLMKGPAALAVACGLAAALIWAGWYVLARHGVTGGGLLPEDLAALRFLVAAPLSLLILRRNPVQFGNLHRTLPMALGVGPAFGIVVGYGFQLAPAGFGGSVTAVTGVLLSLLGAMLWLGERLSARQGVGVLLALTGLALMTLQAPGGGLGYFLAGGALWAIYSVSARASGLGAMEAAGAVAVLSAVIFLPPYFVIAGGRLWQAGASELLLQAIGQGVVTGTLALTLHARAVAVLGAARGALFQSLVPPFVLVLSFIFLGEQPRPLEVFVITLVLTGVALALYPKGPDSQRISK